MGSPFGIIFYATDSIEASRLSTDCYALVDTLNSVFSDYMKESELNRLCATAGTDSFVKVSDHLFHVLLLSKQGWEQSNGAFDITCGPLTHLWRKERKEKRFPDALAIKNAKQKSGFDKMVIDTAGKKIKLLQANMQLDLGGIAAGYIAQKVLELLWAKGIKSALVNASGDIVCSNAPPDKKGWTVGVNVPGEANELLDKSIELENLSVSTSGDVFQYIEHEGKRYSHIINPKTGYGVTFQRNVTIVAKDGTTADWLATACSILSMSKAKKLVKKFNADLLISQIKKGKLKMHITKGFSSYFKK